MAGKNISKFKNTMAHILNEDFMQKVGSMESEDIKTEFLDIIHNPNIVMAPTTRRKYERDMSRQHSEYAVKNYIYQLGMKSAGMGVFK